MAFDMAMAPAVVKLAWKRLLAQGRVSPAPMRFCLVGTGSDGRPVGYHLETDYPYRTPWGWPVLDMDSSVGTLSMGLTSIQAGGEMASLALVMEQGGAEDEVVFDFLAGDMDPEEEQIPSSWSVFNLEEALDNVTKGNLGPGQCVAVVALDTTPSLSDDLPAHMLYAMDGTKDILWVGACAENGRDPQALANAAARACAVNCHSSEVMVISGDTVDLGNGWAIIRHPHRLAVLDVQRVSDVAAGKHGF